MYKFVKSAFADEIHESLDIQMDVLESHGISHIEMRGVNGKNITSYTLDEVRKIKEQLDKRNFKISAIGSPIGKIKITEDFEPHLELFKHTIEIAKILDTKYIRMFSFFIPDGEEAIKYRDEVLNRWRRFIDAAKGKNIILLHENEKDIYGDVPERCLDIFQTLKCDYLRATFDPANFVQCNCETYPGAFKMLLPYIEYMHIKDAKLKDHTVVPAGFGDGKVYEILKELKEKGYRGFVSLEPHLASFKGFAALEQSSVSKETEENGPGQFAIAAEALDKILSNI